jgi:hypothetical protein
MPLEGRMPKHLNRTLSGVDLSAPGGLEALFAYHRARFGDARMMAEAAPADVGTPTGPAAAQQPTVAEHYRQNYGPGSASQPAVPPAQAPTPAPAAGSEAPTAQRVEDLPDWAQKVIRDTRQEAAAQRTGKSQVEQERQAMLDGIAKALGIKADDAPPDPAKLQEMLAQRQSTIEQLETQTRERAVELEAFRAAAKAGADGARLLDSRSFLAEVGKLDPAAEDFTARLDGAVQTALTANPGLRLVQIPTPGQAGIGATGTGAPALGDMAAGELLSQAYSTPK